MRSRVAIAVVVGAGLAVSMEARAAPCGRSDLIDTVPPDGASGIATNAVLEARYASTAEYLGEPVRLVRVGGETKEIVAEFEPNESRLQIKLPEPFEGGASFEVHWPELRGKVSAERGKGKVVRFSVGQGTDAESPRFEGLRSLSWDLKRRESSCDEDLVERYVFKAEIGEASDDGGAGGLTLIVFQTKGPNIGEAPKPVLAAAWPSSGRVSVSLAREDAVGHVCFSALARDLSGRTSAGGASEVCVETIEPPFFEGCAVGGVGRRGRDGSVRLTVLMALVGLAISWTTRRGRRA